MMEGFGVRLTAVKKEKVATTSTNPIHINQGQALPEGTINAWLLHFRNMFSPFQIIPRPNHQIPKTLKLIALSKSLLIMYVEELVSTEANISA